MQIGMIGLGRMGANMVRRLMKAGHECVVYNRTAADVEAMVQEGAVGSASLEEFAGKLSKPRTAWVMIPAAFVDPVIDDLVPFLDEGDLVIDGGNSFYKDDIIRSQRLATRGIRYMDVGTSGGVWGLERGYCLMVGGPDDAFARVEPALESLAPGMGDIPRTEGREGDPSAAEKGYLHCGPAGAGHFVKMVHNGIEYGLMAAYAEGLNILKHANLGSTDREKDAETAPLRNPGEYRFDIDVAAVAEVWRRGSVVSSWLLDLTAKALQESPSLDGFSGRVSDSGEGRWTSLAAIETGVPAPVLTASLYSRFASRDEDDFASKVLSAMRFEFGGHHEKK